MSGHYESLDKVHAYWEQVSASVLDADGLKPTARDPNLQRVVEDAMLRRLSGGSALLDLGCGDGSSTARFSRLFERTVGVDYVEGFVARAQADHARPGLQFRHGDAMNLGPVRDEFGPFNVAVSIRCLINLGCLENQAKAIGQIAESLRPGGLYLTSEGWREGWDGLNARRAAFGLPPLQVAAFNTLISRQDFETAAGRYFEIVGYESVGYYLYMSRLFHPLLVRPAEPSYGHPINAVAALTQQRLPQGDDFMDCDYAGVYVLRRK
jgi:SAM-dependent methyltransferase